MASMQKSADTRERMLAVAETLFAERGYEGAHLDEIAKRVGVRKTALYYYFESKEALYVAVLVNLLEPMTRIAIDILEQDAPVYTRVVRVVDAINDLLAERPSCAQILIRILIDWTPVDLTPIAPVLSHMLEVAVAFFDEGVAKGVFRRLSGPHAFQSGMGMMLLHYAGGETTAGLLDQSDLYVGDAVARRREQFREMLFHGIMAEPPPKADA